MMLVNLVLIGRLASEHGVSMYLKKIKNLADLQWTMELMLDCVGQQPDLIWPIRILAPKGGEIGILDTLVFKHHLKTELLSKVMEDIDLDPEEK